MAASYACTNLRRQRCPTRIHRLESATGVRWHALHSLMTAAVMLVAGCNRDGVRSRADNPASSAGSADSLVTASIEPSAVPGSIAPSAQRASLLPALQTDGALVPLAIPKFRDAVLSLPAGAREPRSVIVALHGNYDRPEWQCQVWSDVTNRTSFVLCPRGIPRSDAPRSADRWTYGSSKATFAELSAARQALGERYGQYVSPSPAVLVAFSLGAIYAAREVAEEPAAFPRVALIEGGYDGWTQRRIRRYSEGGGERVLFACAQTVCRNAAERLVPLFEKHGGRARVVYAANAGHTYDGKVAKMVGENWAWLTERTSPAAVNSVR